MENRDPIEDDPKYKDILSSVDKEIEKELGDPIPMGYCHVIWVKKKQILKDRYGVDWKSPAELNPNIEFD